MEAKVVEVEEEAEDVGEEEAEVEDAEAEDRTMKGISQTMNGQRSWNASASGIKKRRKKSRMHAVERVLQLQVKASKTRKTRILGMTTKAMPVQQTA